MYTIAAFPQKPPNDAELPLARTQLALVLESVINDLIKDGENLMKAGTASEFGTIVHSTADKLAVTCKFWSALSRTIREHWHE